MGTVCSDCHCGNPHISWLFRPKFSIGGGDDGKDGHCWPGAEDVLSS